MAGSESMRNISYQGIEGSYSHSIARHLEPQAILHGFPTFEESMEAVEQNRCDLAIIPIENNIGGRVAEIHHLLLNTTLHIVAEYFLRITHCLLAHGDANMRTITHVFSHPQALLQCRKFIHAHRYDVTAEFDTAFAAKKIAGQQNPKYAAIASNDCAKIYALKSVQQNIADDARNITRFVVMKNSALIKERYVNPITALLFQVRSVSAALYKALGGFATNNINILKLESYVNPKGFDIAYFYAEIAANIHAASHAHVLEELSHFAEWVRIIGVFEQNRTPLSFSH